jgi:hypothetical protein
VILSGKFAAGCESTPIGWPHTEINDPDVAEDAGALAPDEPETAQLTVQGATPQGCTILNPVSDRPEPSIYSRKSSVVEEIISRAQADQRPDSA